MRPRAAGELRRGAARTGNGLVARSAGCRGFAAKNGEKRRGDERAPERFELPTFGSVGRSSVMRRRLEMPRSRRALDDDTPDYLRGYREGFQLVLRDLRELE